MVHSRISDSIEDCSRMEDNSKLHKEATQAIANVLESLTRIIQGQGLTMDQTQIILNSFARLQDADYSGPNFYDGTARLPKEYSQSLSKESGGEDEPPGEDTEEPVPEDQHQEDLEVREQPKTATDTDSEDTEGPEEGFEEDPSVYKVII